MKLHISFDVTDIEAALRIASEVAEHADILEVGTPLIYAHGASAVEQFKKAFPDNTILADAKIIDRGKESATIFAKAGADWITVMAGTRKNVIHAACTAAQTAGKKVLLDLLDTGSPGQLAMEAKKLGADALLFHRPEEATEPHMLRDKWEMIRGNSDLPIFIAAGATKKEDLEEILSLKPDGIIAGKNIVDASNPADEAAAFKKTMVPSNQ